VFPIIGNNFFNVEFLSYTRLAPVRMPIRKLPSGIIMNCRTTEHLHVKHFSLLASHSIRSLKSTLTLTESRTRTRNERRNRENVFLHNVLRPGFLFVVAGKLLNQQ